MKNPDKILSVIVIARNEERGIAECLRSAAFADEIVVVDSQSTDRTVEIAKIYTDKIFVVPWKGYADAKESAVKKTTGEWILWLDADERITPGLSDEIRSIVDGDAGRYSAYEVARRAFFLGKWIRHCGWYPGYVVRLFRKDKGKFTSRKVHESLAVDGEIGRLAGDIIHFTDEDLFHYFSKFNNYTSLAAGDLYLSGKRSACAGMVINPVVLFFRMYIMKFGFLDGMHGLVLSMLSAAYVFVKYAKLREMVKSAGVDALREKERR